MFCIEVASYGTHKREHRSSQATAVVYRIEAERPFEDLAKVVEMPEAG